MFALSQFKKYADDLFKLHPISHWRVLINLWHSPGALLHLKCALIWWTVPLSIQMLILVVCVQRIAFSFVVIILKIYVHSFFHSLDAGFLRHFIFICIECQSASDWHMGGGTDDRSDTTILLNCFFYRLAWVACRPFDIVFSSWDLVSFGGFFSYYLAFLLLPLTFRWHYTRDYGRTNVHCV